MNNRMWAIGAALASIAIIALGWFLGIAPRLAATATAEADRASVEIANQQQALQLATMKADFENLPALKSELKKLQRSLPPETRYDEILAEVHDLARRNGLSITGMTAVAATTLDPTGAAPVEGEEAAPADGEEAPAATAEPTLIGVPMTISLKGDDQDFFELMHDLVELDRLFLVTDYSLAVKESEAGAPTYTGTIEGYVYVLTDPSLAQPAAPAEPAPEEPAEEEPAVEPTPAPTGVPAPTPTATQTPAP